MAKGHPGFPGFRSAKGRVQGPLGPLVSHGLGRGPGNFFPGLALGHLPPYFGQGIPGQASAGTFLAMVQDHPLCLVFLEAVGGNFCRHQLPGILSGTITSGSHWSFFPGSGLGSFGRTTGGLAQWGSALVPILPTELFKPLGLQKNLFKQIGGL